MANSLQFRHFRQRRGFRATQMGGKVGQGMVGRGGGNDAMATGTGLVKDQHN